MTRFLKTAFFTINILFHTSILAQSNSFEGSIMYSDKLNRDASLSIYIDSSYFVTGIINRYLGTTKLENSVSGKFNFEDNSIYLKENRSSANSCPIYINGWVKNLFDNIYVIAGIFQSTNTKFCDSGHINLVNRDFKFNLYNKALKFTELNDSLAMLVLKKSLQTKIDEEKVFKTVLSTNKINLRVDKDTFILRIYDNLRVDGDKVKISFNNIVVANNLVITGKAFEYILIAKKGNNILNIKAMSEGSIPMNTSKVELYNYRLHEYYENKLLLNQQSTYIIHYE
jgi:hypothetical protein